MNVDSALVVLLAEALLAVLLIAVAAFWLGRQKNIREQHAADTLINKLFDEEDERAKELTQFIKNNITDISSSDLNDLLDAIKTQERTLYQKIIEIFIKRDCEMLINIDSDVKNMAETYGNMTRRSKSATQAVISGTEVDDAGPKESNDEELKAAHEKVSQYKLQAERISEQLNVAMSSMDEISAEYTRMFNSDKSQEELESSRQRMLKTFSTAEHKIHDALKASGIKVSREELME